MSAAAAAAPHETIPNGIRICNWSITTVKQPILGDAARESMAEKFGFPLPEMFFGNNTLRLEHESGLVIGFNAADAIARVDSNNDPIKVSYSEEWLKRREHATHKIKDVVRPFDWTYTSDYKGSLSLHGVSFNCLHQTDQQIDLDKLRRPDPILFYDEVILFEDELADNGSAIFVVKIRVMPTSFFILARFFCRVDDVLVRINDTRIHQEFDKNYALREFCSREMSFPALREKIGNKLEEMVYKQPQELLNVLPITFTETTRIELPSETRNR